MKESIAVLLAAYNGSRYIEEQISSILSSVVSIPVSIEIGLDPSDDGTERILVNIAGESVRVNCNQKPSGGACQNFSRLVDHALTLDDKYYAFSDQDDLWDECKLAEGLSKLRDMENQYGQEIPLLVFSDSRLVDENLNTFAPSFMAAEGLNPSNIYEFSKLTIQNVGQGCTFLFNKALLELASPIPENARMHDHWIMMVACAFGKIAYLDKPLLSYRQHSSNVLGASDYSVFGAIDRFINQAGSISHSLKKSQCQAGSFAFQYKSRLPAERYEFLVEFSKVSEKKFFSRKMFCLKHRLKMSGKLRTVGLYVCI
ncbi:hypothetical protein ACM26W_10990 [Halomonas sp. HK25]|uniref:hypothetical protein n=1 Tax=Halomonas sp. HK25 TaxID=3394321 RepID=UPI0039FCD03A